MNRLYVQTPVYNSFIFKPLSCYYIFFFLFSKLFPLLVNSIWPCSNHLEFKKKKIPAAVWCPRIWTLSNQMKEEKKKNRKIKRRVILSFCRLAFTSLNKRSFVLIISRTHLAFSSSKLAIALLFPLQIKDQSLNIFSSFSIRLWLKLPPPHLIHTIALLGKRRIP